MPSRRVRSDTWILLVGGLLLLGREGVPLLLLLLRRHGKTIGVGIVLVVGRGRLLHVHVGRDTAGTRLERQAWSLGSTTGHLQVRGDLLLCLCLLLLCLLLCLVVGLLRRLLLLLYQVVASSRLLGRVKTSLDEVLTLGLGHQRLELGSSKSVHEASLGHNKQ